MGANCNGCAECANELSISEISSLPLIERAAYYRTRALTFKMLIAAGITGGPIPHADRAEACLNLADKYEKMSLLQLQGKP